VCEAETDVLACATDEEEESGELVEDAAELITDAEEYLRVESFAAAVDGRCEFAPPPCA
jgi:hypothetical protein